MIGVIGDFHQKDELSYAEYFSDRRNGEKKEVLDKIVESLSDCKTIIFLGDCFNSKNNSSESIKQFVSFLERFAYTTEIIFLSGNHEKKPDGKWIVVNKPIMVITDKKTCWLCPYMYRSEIDGATTQQDVSNALRENFEQYSSSIGNNVDFVFAHHAITGTNTANGSVSSLNEPVLDAAWFKVVKRVFGGHIHQPQDYDNVTITGNVFTQETGEDFKYVYRINDDNSIDSIKLPVRPILKVENPTEEKLASIPQYAIVKAVITDRSVNVEKTSELLLRFDASLIVEKYPNEKRASVDHNDFSFDTEHLLREYAKHKELSPETLLKGYNLIK